ncbi:MAG: DUF3098 domain-containing protein [Flavobacteriales bacterium]
MKKEKISQPNLFGSVNYKLLLIGLAISLVGFILMIGGGSVDGKSFNPEIFNAQRITIAPIVILIGIVIDVIAIMKTGKE